MLDYKDKEIRKLVSSILRTIAGQIEEDESLLENLCKEKKSTKSIKQAEKKATQYPDIFLLFKKEGKENLELVLSNYEATDLKHIVVENGLDPTRKVRRWRKKERFIHYIVETVEKQLSKGKAFSKVGE